MSVKMRMPKLTESLSAPLQTDTKPYLIKPVPIGNREKLKLVGGTVAVNQLIQNGNFVDSTGWTTGTTNTLTVSGGVARLEIASGASTYNRDIRATTQKIVDNGHVYLVSFDALGTGAFVGGTLRLAQVTEQITIIAFDTLTATKKRYAGICKPAGLTDPSGSNYRRRIVAEPTTVNIGDYFEVSNFMSIDLTAYFNPQIADYAYTLETGQAGSGIAWLQSFGFFNKDFFPFDSGSLLSVKTSGHVSGGHSYPLSDIELRGIPKLMSGAIEYNGDSYASDGTVTRRYGVVTLNGSENFTLSAQSSVNPRRFLLNISAWGAKGGESQTAVTSYLVFNPSATATETFGTFRLSAVYLTIPDGGSRFASVNDLKTYLGTNPLTVVYELATPTTETADAYESPQIVETGGTESYIDGRTVEMPVGNVSEYCEAVKSVSIGMRMGKGLSVKMRMGGEL